MWKPLFKTSKDPAYQIWESIVIGLFQEFKFNFENLGTKLKPLNKTDLLPAQVYSKLTKPTYFGETKKVHFNRYYAYGSDITGYPMADKTTAYHHFTYENYQRFWPVSLNVISNSRETFTYIFATNENFFMEGCNLTFLKSKKYSTAPEYPIYHPKHAKYFSSAFFKKNNLPVELLNNAYSLTALNIKIDNDIIKTLHFSQRLFNMSVLLLGTMQECFGDKKRPKGKIAFLKKYWAPQTGQYSSKLDNYRLNILSFLYLSFHPAATLLCYGLYRDKYGINQGVRTTIYIKYQNKSYAFRDFLALQIKKYLRQINIAVTKNPDLAKKIIPYIKSALKLAEMYGIGYKTNSQQKQNVHLNCLVDFTPSKKHPSLEKINFLVEHNPSSPLWRLFYEFGGDWWNDAEIADVFAGEGHHWERLKSVPRSRFVHYCHQYAANFWKDHHAITKDYPELHNLIKNNINLALS